MSIGKRFFKIFRSQTQGFWDQLGSAPKTKANGDSYKSEEYSSSGNENTGTSGSDSRENEYLANLELERFVSFEQVQKAHRRMIKKYHPDLHATNPEKREYAEQITIRLNEALNYFETKVKKGAGS